MMEMTYHSKVFEFKKKKKVSSKFGGSMYYLFFSDGQSSFKTCVADNYRNFDNWRKFVKNALRGDQVKGLRIKSKGLIDADSKPIYVGSDFR